MKHRIIALLLAALVALAGTLQLSCADKEEEPESYGPPQVQFPQDEGAHPEFGVEWWYLNALLTDQEGRKYTAMVAYFRPTLRIISISDLETGTFYQEVPSLWEILHTTPNFAEGVLDLRWNESDRWYRTDQDSLSYQLTTEAEDIGFSLSLSSEKPHLLVGGDGLIEWTEGDTYYYSLTRLHAEGTIDLEGETIDVEGIAWMDHQWMESMAERGWNWFSVQLDDGTDIIFWEIVNPDGSVISRDMTIMFQDESIYHTTDIDTEIADRWVSPETGEEYGVVWQVREENHDLDLEIRARHAEQEILMFKGEQPDMAWQFWEGATTVTGQLEGENVSGTGYAELVPIFRM